jgi:hypothetical protein
MSKLQSITHKTEFCTEFVVQNFYSLLLWDRRVGTDFVQLVPSKITITELHIFKRYIPARKFWIHTQADIKIWIC